MARAEDESPPHPEYICEWTNCLFKTDEVQDLFHHVNGHVKDIAGHTCRWKGCHESRITVESQFKLHLSFHAYHSKLMTWGSLVLEEINDKSPQKYICSQDATSRNVLPELPEYLTCLWKGCPGDHFDDISVFFSHVEEHIKEDLPTISSANDGNSSTAAANSSNSQSFPCLWADCETKIIGHRGHLKVHLRSHSQEKCISCPYCGWMFVEKTKFIDHILRQYTKEVAPNINTESNICNICCKEFASERIYREHVKSHNSSCKCPICGFVTRATSLKKHILYRHSNERQFACHHCPAKCKTLSDLRKHLRSHSDSSDGVFECCLCPFVARSNAALKTHWKKDHAPRDKETYKCHLCEVTLQRANSLTRHLSRKHQISLPEGKSRFKFKKHADGLIRAVIDWM